MAENNLISVSDDFVISTPDAKEEPTECIGRTLFSFLQLHRDKVAQIDAKTGRGDTFGQLFQRSIRTALHMKSRNINPEDIISLCTKNHLDSPVPYIAATFLGARIASLDPSFSQEEMTHLLKLVHPKMIFVEPECLATIEKIVQNENFQSEVVVFGDSQKHTPFGAFLEAHPNEETFEPVKIENLKETALIHFSSGTTGLPKGICLSHYSLLGQLMNVRTPQGADEGVLNRTELLKKMMERFKVPLTTLCYTTLYWLSGTGTLVGSIFEGSCRLVCPYFDGNEIWDLIEKYKPIMLTLTPIQIIQMLANRKEVDVNSVIRVLAIGSPISKDYCLKLKEAFPRATIAKGYGQTEVSGPLTLFTPTDKFGRSLRETKDKIESVGLPIRGTTYRVVDLETGKNLGPNQTGELRVKTKFVMNGYHNLDSSETFDEDGWLKTGDLVYYDEDYCFYVVDRIKESFKYQGWFIAPAVLENELLNHPAVQMATVLGIPKDDGHHPMALVVRKEGSNASEKEIEEFVERRVPERQRLRGGVRFVDSLPLTVTGKVDRRKVKKMASEIVTQN